MMVYQIAMVSKKGDKEINEDYCQAIEGEDFCGLVLADGLGGFEAGEAASKFVVEYVVNRLKEDYRLSPDYLEMLIRDAHLALLQEQAED